jgi:hypothetical protein
MLRGFIKRLKTKPVNESRIVRDGGYGDKRLGKWIYWLLTGGGKEMNPYRA